MSEVEINETIPCLGLLSLNPLLHVLVYQLQFHFTSPKTQFSIDTIPSANPDRLTSLADHSPLSYSFCLSTNYFFSYPSIVVVSIISWSFAATVFSRSSMISVLFYCLWPRIPNLLMVYIVAFFSYQIQN
jgi:hypothetical protein